MENTLIKIIIGGNVGGGSTPVANLESESNILPLAASQGKKLNESLKGLNLTSAADGYVYPFKQLGNLREDDLGPLLDSLNGLSHAGHYRFRVAGFTHDLEIFSNGGAVFQLLTGTIMIDAYGNLDTSMYNMTTPTKLWRVKLRGGDWSKWNDFSKCALASQMIKFDGVIDNVYVQQMSLGSIGKGKVLYVKNASSGITFPGTVGFPGKQFVVAVEDENGAIKYYSNWKERIKHMGTNLKPYPGEVYVCGDTMYHFNGIDLVQYSSENQFIDFAGIIDFAELSNSTTVEKGTKDNVYYVYDARGMGSLIAYTGFVVKVDGKYYNTFENKDDWADLPEGGLSVNDSDTYENKYYRAVNGELYTGIGGKLEATFPIRRSEFDDLVHRIEILEGTGIELTPEFLTWAASDKAPKTLTIKTAQDWKLTIDQQK